MNGRAFLSISAALAVLAFLAIRALDGRRTGPNVVLISIDTLRPDHLGCYGYAHDTSPHIDRLAARGVRFETARSSTTWTLAAHMSLMTGLPDEFHGVISDVSVLDPRRAMLAEIYRDAGYRTAGFFGGPYLHPHFGFGRGFDHYENCGVKTAYDLGPLSPRQEIKHLQRQHAEAHRVVTAKKIQDRAEAWLRENASEPFFLFLHHWDCHYDYMAPERLVRRFAPDYRGDLDPSDFLTNERISPDMSAEDRRFLMACYDAEIYTVDREIGRLMALLDELGLADDTLVVVTSDHGEEFFEHGNKGHRNNLYEETLRIPLVFAGPGVSRGAVVEAPVRLFDVAPTLLDLCGLANRPEMFGVSLAPLLRGEAPPELLDLPICAELTNIPTDPRTGRRVFRKDVCLGRGEFKLIRREKRSFDESRRAIEGGDLLEPAAFELYDLGRDPGEQRDLAGEAGPLFRSVRTFADRFERQFQAALARLERGEPIVREIPPDLSEILRQNGYTR